MLFSQTFDPGDLGVVGLLVLLEGALSVDNALVLGLLAMRIPKPLVARALAYGLAGAFVFRLVAVLLASVLLRWPAVKLIGGAYLIYLAFRHFFLTPDVAQLASKRPAGFWRLVLQIEMTDMVFAVDNILAAVALVGPPPPGWPTGRLHPKLWVILLGGMLGVVLTRFAAAVCMRLIRKFPRTETCAYLIVMLVGLKLVWEWYGIDFQQTKGFAFWAFWVALAGCVVLAIIPGTMTPELRELKFDRSGESYVTKRCLPPGVWVPFHLAMNNRRKAIPEWTSCV